MQALPMTFYGIMQKQKECRGSFLMLFDIHRFRTFTLYEKFEAVVIFSFEWVYGLRNVSFFEGCDHKGSYEGWDDDDDAVKSEPHPAESRAR